MKKLTLKDLQEKELDILIAFDEVCRCEGLKYSLGAGTMIGAIRHKGFIPWDDDIDIFMTREEYEKFKKKVSQDSFIVKDKYKVLFPGSKGYPYPFIKIIDISTMLYEKNTVHDKLGVWIDIFPIDYCAQEEKGALKTVKSQLLLYTNYSRARRRYKNNNIYNILKNFLWLPFFRIQTNNLKNQMLKKERAFSENSKMKYAGPMVWATSLNDVYLAEYFDEYTQIEFENQMFMMFKRYDEILKHRYGNYMKLPPENERVTHEPEAYER